MEIYRKFTDGSEYKGPRDYSLSADCSLLDMDGSTYSLKKLNSTELSFADFPDENCLSEYRR